LCLLNRDLDQRASDISSNRSESQLDMGAPGNARERRRRDRTQPRCGGFAEPWVPVTKAISSERAKESVRVSIEEPTLSSEDDDNSARSRDLLRSFRARRFFYRLPRVPQSLHPWAEIGVGTKGNLCPSLRTGLADLLHPALQLVVNFQEDRQAAVYACLKENKPTAEK
jgi:hypothetical protein